MFHFYTPKNGRKPWFTDVFRCIEIFCYKNRTFHILYGPEFLFFSLFLLHTALLLGIKMTIFSYFYLIATKFDH